MAQTIVRRPHATRLNSGAWRDQNNNAWPEHQEVADNWDGTYIYATGSTAVEMAFYTANYQLAANERCHAVRLWTRVGPTSPGFDYSYDAWLRPEGAMGDGAYISATGGGPQNLTAFYNAEFSQNALNNLSSWHRNNAAGTTTATVYDTWLDLHIRTRPVATATGPTGGGKPLSPTVTWNNNHQMDQAWGYQVHIRRTSDFALVYDSGEVSGSAASHTITAVLAQGTAYSAHVRIATEFRGTGWWSDWSAVSFTTDSVPTCTVSAPTGTITDTNRPTAVWTYISGGAAQNRYRVKIFSSFDYAAPGFNPETWPATWDSGDVFSTATTRQVAAALPAGPTFKAYVKVGDAVLGFGPWASGPTFTITISGLDKAARAFFVPTSDVGTAGPGFYSFDDTDRAGSYTWKSAPFRDPTGRQVEIREVQVYARTYDAGATLAVSVGGSTKLVTLDTPGRHQLSVKFRERGEVLDVQVVSTAGSVSTKEAPTIEVVRVGWRPLHMLR